MKARLFISGLIAVIFTGCGETLPPVDFTHTTELSNPLKVTFSADVPTSASQYGEMKLTWDFGDGVTLTGESPAHTFKEPGDYTVKLIAEASKSTAKAEKTKVIPIAVDIKDLDFTYTSNPSSPLELMFEAKGNLDNGLLDFEWDFGDSKTANGKSTIKIFAEPKKYPVTMTAKVRGTNYTQIVKKIIDLNLAINDLDFTFNSDQFDPLNVEFIASGKPTIGELEYEWDFGFGTVKKGKAVVQKFSNVGQYDVKLTAKIIDSNVVKILPFKINTSMSITNADFTYGSDGLDPLNVIFSGIGDSPTGNVDYEWDFGGGIKLRTQNTPYRFNDYGDHLVTLKVSIPGTKVAQLITKTINVAPPEIKDLDFKYTQSQTNALEFYLEATAKAPYGTISYDWDFGWGKTAKGNKTRVLFDNYGSNLVTLSVSINDTPASAYLTKIITIPAPIIDFPKDKDGTIKGFNYIRHPKNPLNVHFISNATASAGELEYDWDFGWAKKGDGDQVIVDFGYYDTYLVKMVAKIKGTNIKRTHYQNIDVGLNDNLTIDCYDIGGDDINNLSYMCKPTFSGKELKNPTFAWDFGHLDSGSANFSSERMPTHKFALLGKYTVTLTVTDDAVIKPIVVTKDIIVLTKPIIDFRVSVVEQKWGRDEVLLRADLYKTWYNINKDQVNVTVKIENAPEGSYHLNGTFINDPRGSYPVKDTYKKPNTRWNQGGSPRITITYCIKNSAICGEPISEVRPYQWRDYLD